jgi:hypothetical protein
VRDADARGLFEVVVAAVLERVAGAEREPERVTRTEGDDDAEEEGDGSALLDSLTVTESDGWEDEDMLEEDDA